jgi:NMD protein affecting ribosome stability and mRNA decay
MTGPREHTDFTHQPRRDRMYEERVNDAYRARGKWPEPTLCPECGAIYHDGRWQWGEEKARSEQHLCPACQRIRDKVPAAKLTISGGFFTEHREEILKLIRNAESKAKAEHALERIMAIDEQADRSVITFTDAHLAHGIGEALHHAYQGELDSRYTDADDLLRITWSR